ncbi:hypothetical protein ABBQ38_011510 [Trebouxia sp. C0009 RCD-2024]
MEHTLSGKQQMMTDVSSDVSGSLTWLELLSEGRLSVSELLDIESREHYTLTLLNQTEYVIQTAEATYLS